MGRFYFHVREGNETVCDEEGQSLPDAFAAQVEAERAAREILAEAIRSGKESIPEAVVIADQQGREIDTIRLAALLPGALK